MKKEEIFQKLENWGCDINGAMERFLADEELYLSCLEMAAADSNFEKLESALNEKEAEQAFDYAHTLKGVFANLGLTPMFLLSEQIVEPLRSASSKKSAGKGIHSEKFDFEKLLNVYEALLSAKEELKQMLGM